MKYPYLAASHLVLLGWAVSPGVARPAPADLGTRARDVFAAKCVECHSPALAHPKGKFGYVLDLNRLAANPKLVVRFDPARSKLWKQIEEGEMPPDDARAGPLTPEEKGLVRLWIEAGAPPALSASLETAGPRELAAVAPAPPFRRLWRLVGKLHVLIVHFPIALLAAAALAESWRIWARRVGPSPVVRFCVLLGAAGAVAAAAAGWIHASSGGFGAEAGGALALHRWLGTAAAAGALATAAACEWDVFRGRRTVLFRGVLFASAALVGAAGHFGGMLVYGNDFFNL